MSNATQTFKLYEVLKGGEPVTVAKIAEELKIKVLSVPVYIHGLKKAKANITAIREGRKVTSYQMTNAAEVKVSEFRKNSADAIPRIKASVAGDNKKIEVTGDDAAANTAVSDREFADIRSSLGLPSSGGGFAND